MPYRKNIPLDVPNTLNDLDEAARVSKDGPANFRIEFVGGRLSGTRDHAKTVQALIDAGAVTPQQAGGFRAVLKAARDAVYADDGFTVT